MFYTYHRRRAVLRVSLAFAVIAAVVVLLGVPKAADGSAVWPIWAAVAD